jgi:hypothetical protein
MLHSNLIEAFAYQHIIFARGWQQAAKDQQPTALFHTKIVYLPSVKKRIMQKRILCLWLMLLPVLAAGQFSDDFSDGNFTANPAWVGDADKFTVEGGILRLTDNAAGSAYLATQSSVVANTQWEFWVRIAFAPSDNNHPKIYLVSDNQNLGGPLNGYYVQIGKTGTDNKRLYFYRQNGSSRVELMAGDHNLASTTNNIIRVRVTRDQEGNWDFRADAQGGRLFVPQGQVFDNTHTTTSWFGVHCLYTVTNSNRFYFDDFYVGDIVEDDDPPKVEYLQVISANTLDVHFSKVVEQSGAERVANYVADGGLGSPMLANRQPAAPNVVRLMYSQGFAENQMYQIQIQGVRDYYDNLMEPFSGSFVYYVPARFDVVFNELMVNNSPVVGLPPYDWFELYNTTGFPVNLEGWVFQHGTTRRVLPFANLPAGGYVVFTTPDAHPHMAEYENVVAIPGLSSVALTQGGTTLQLFDPEDRLISHVSYTDQWYRDPAKSNGGWSLEKIDPYNLCQGAENWKASVSPQGGTPGAVNSVRDDNPDTSRPDLIRVGYLNGHTIQAYFSESLDEAYLRDPSLFVLDNGIGAALLTFPVLPQGNAVILGFENPLQPGVIYELSVSEILADCAGNQINKRMARVAVPQDALAFDVVINEVLFNPPDRGSRYIEIYNRSDKVLDMKNMLATSKDTIDNYLVNIQHISQESYLFFPGDYVVLTTNPDAVRNTFMTPNPQGFIRLSGMPRMTNSNGILVLATISHDIIDMFVYKEDMQFPLLTSYKGVALERLNYNRPTQDRSNWHSAAQGAGFGTPGYKNSQFTLEEAAESGSIELSPPVFSPDGDGQDDVLNIAYAFNEPGYVANVTVFDGRGRVVRRLVRGELLATEGVMTWDGTTDDRQKAPMGIYIVFLEVFDLQGNVKNYRKTTVLGGKL